LDKSQVEDQKKRYYSFFKDEIAPFLRRMVSKESAFLPVRHACGRRECHFF